MKRILIFMTLCCVWIGIFAVGSYSRKGNRLIFTLAKEKVRMDFCADGMFRVYHSVDGNFAPDEQWMVRNYDFSPVDYTVSEETDAWIITTGVLQIRAMKSPFSLIVSDKNGKVLYTEKDEQRFFPDSVRTSVVMQPDEHFFGFGERMDFMDQRGRKVYLNVELGSGPRPAVGGKDILRANYCPVPFMMSTLPVRYFSIRLILQNGTWDGTVPTLIRLKLLAETWTIILFMVLISIRWLTTIPILPEKLRCFLGLRWDCIWVHIPEVLGKMNR